jgi:cytoskeletal protein CcmA (bactofilin family)
MFAKKRKPPRIDTLIGTGTRIDGSVTFSGGLRVDGAIRGNVSALENDKETTLVLSEQGRINGEIKVTRAVINGEVLGPLYVNDSLELMPQARVTGDVHYGSIEVHSGAVVSGKLVNDQRASERNIVELKPVSSN